MTKYFVSTVWEYLSLDKFMINKPKFLRISGISGAERITLYKNRLKKYFRMKNCSLLVDFFYEEGIEKV